MVNIATIVVTYNRIDLLKECIDSLLNQNYKDFDILIFDIDSSDGTKDYVLSLSSSKIKYYNTGSNIGGAGGFNFGLRKAYEEGYEYYWLMDDDSIPENDALEKMIKASDDLKEYGFLASKVNWIDGTLCQMNIPDFINENNNGYKRITRATFVGFFLNKEVLIKIGLPIKEFFIWADDTNYSLRVNKDYNNYYVEDSIIVHKMKTNSSADIVHDKSGRYSRYYYAFRNRYYNARLNKKRMRYLLGIIKKTILILFIGSHKFKRWFYMYKGFFAGLRFKPKIEYLK